VLQSEEQQPEEHRRQLRYEVTIESQVELRKYPPPGRSPGEAPWIERMIEATKSTEPITLSFEGRRFTWHPGSDEFITSVTVMVEDPDNYEVERFAMERFLSALSYRFNGAISVYTSVGYSHRDEFAPSVRQPRQKGGVNPVPEEIELADSSDELSICLGLMREGLSSRSRALTFLSYWKVIELAVGRRRVQRWMGDRYRRLYETRVAAAHAIPDNRQRLLYHPDDPSLFERLSEDIGVIYELAMRAIGEQWPDPVREKGQQFAT
jgi:hypothetical protein